MAQTTDAVIKPTNGARIPVAARLQSGQSTAGNPAAPMPRARVLIIDDEHYIREGMKALLEGEGIDVITHDSMITLPLILRTTHPDIILLDVEMPALSGTAFFQLARGTFALSNTSVILFSGLAKAELAELADVLGADGFIPKTDDPSRIVDEVKKSIYLHRAQSALEKCKVA